MADRARRRGVGTVEALVAAGLLVTLAAVASQGLGRGRGQVASELARYRLESLVEDLVVVLEAMPADRLDRHAAGPTALGHRELAPEAPGAGLLAGWRAAPGVTTRVRVRPLADPRLRLVEVEATFRPRVGRPRTTRRVRVLRGTP